jgi:flagellin
MRINTNVGALNASRNVFVNNMATESSMRKLSSGLRISRAGDDAAGLAIANRLRTQSRALVQASNNAEQGNAMLQIAEGSAQTIQRILERQKELLVQRASTGNNGGVSATIDAEVTALNDEIGRIVAGTRFQGQALFSATALVFQVGDNNTASESQISITLNYTAPSGSPTLANVDTRLDDINTILGTIGAAQNRLDYTVTNLKSAVVNVRAAESTIRDVDMAEEMATFTKNSVLVQAATSMLAQANQSSQSILSLLR